ncbi:MAG TPA: D-aminoacyl-tRNA deacylase [Methanomassiliicoccales archaeon]|nr:D-aminoacyl-tRNA deacylase [Methanomassiliicoccales archaeon]
MRLLVCSLDDVASVNIRDRLFEAYPWLPSGEFRGHEVRARGEDILVTIPGLHLKADNLDADVSTALGVKLDRVVFLSRHKAASAIPTLTVHPVGNYGKAEFGGREGVLVPSDPDAMTSSLRSLQSNGKDLEFQISFEVTHHGPLLQTPTMFIEIGSAADRWGHVKAAEAIAKTLMETKALDAPKVVGIGGGHYAPRFSELITTKKVSFGHMIPGYVIDRSNDEELKAAIKKALEATKGAKMVYLHRKSMSRSKVTHIKKLVESIGVKAVESGDLEDIA